MSPVRRGSEQRSASEGKAFPFFLEITSIPAPVRSSKITDINRVSGVTFASIIGMAKSPFVNSNLFECEKSTTICA